MIEEIVNVSAAFGAARNQQSRGTCLAFASSDFNRFANTVNSPLSVDFLAHHAVKHIPTWKSGDGLHVSAVLAALQKPGQPEEASYAYDPNDHGRPLLPVPTNVGVLYQSAPTGRNLDADKVIATIKNGQAVCLVIALSLKFYKPDAGIVEYATDYLQNRLHAVLCVGVGRHAKTNEMYVLIRNSWGETWGHQGHAWLHEEYLKTHLVDSFSL